MWSRPVCFTNAQIVTESGIASSIRYSARILSLDAQARPGDLVLDLEGAVVFPGLVNAHDHLEVNHYGRVKCRGVYQNASQWVDDMRPRLRDDPALRAGQSHPLSDRLFIGGLKNLLAGVTTVAHHNPFYPELRFRFSVRVVRHYGWAHSFYLQNGRAGARGERGGDVTRRFRSASAKHPFFIHLAEGTDDSARRELKRLDELGCLGTNSVLIHGVGLSGTDWTKVVERGAGLVWCPASNFFLLGESAKIRQFIESSPDSADRISLGTDSRLSGSLDLLEELRVATDTGDVEPRELVRMVTINPARQLGLCEAGRIAPGLPADLLVIRRLSDDPAQALLAATRKDVVLVTLGGCPMAADPSFAGAFAAYRARAQLLKIDGVVKLLNDRLFRRIQRCSIQEEGLERVQR